MKAESVLIRPEDRDDARDITAVHDATFGQPNEGLLVLELRSTEGFDPRLSLVAETQQGQVIGHTLFTPIQIIGPEKSAPSLALAPMAVLPEFQKQGIGSRLVEDGLEACRGAGHESVIVLGHPEYYSRFGFRPASEWNIRCPFEGIPNAVFMAMELIEGALAEAAGTVEYTAPFQSV